MVMLPKICTPTMQCSSFVSHLLISAVILRILLAHDSPRSDSCDENFVDLFRDASRCCESNSSSDGHEHGMYCTVLYSQQPNEQEHTTATIVQRVLLFEWKYKTPPMALTPCQRTCLIRVRSRGCVVSSLAFYRLICR